ncbi:MAG: YihY/virulence factor BrkB family protein [Gemmatimonadetes bacterium]|nr:YihY/virulence factor BrkB family protein [Gemmatimonadota bacterium]
MEPVEGGLKRLIRGRIIGFLLVLGLGVLLLVALVLQAMLSALASGTWISVLNQVGSVLLFTLVFGALYRTLPDVRIGWREVWLGAAATAILFTLGQFLVGLYLGRSSVGSRYGTAGTLVAFLVWLYYSAAVFFFGAELTQVGARRYGKGLEPEEGARRVRQVAVVPDEEEGGASPATPPDRIRVSGEASYP